MADPLNTTLTFVAVVAAVAAALFSWFSLRLQRASVGREEARERPGFTCTLGDPADGMPLVEMTHVRPAPFPQWTIKRVRSLAPERALVGRSIEGIPTTALATPALELNVDVAVWGHLNPKPTRFFAVFVRDDDKGTVRFAFDFVRANGNAFTIVIEVSSNRCTLLGVAKPDGRYVEL